MTNEKKRNIHTKKKARNFLFYFHNITKFNESECEDIKIILCMPWH